MSGALGLEMLHYDAPLSLSGCMREGGGRREEDRGMQERTGRTMVWKMGRGSKIYWRVEDTEEKNKVSSLINK